MLSMKLSPHHYISQLSDEDRSWIESDLRPIIYINFGTIISLSDEQIEKLFLALKTLQQYRILWKLDKRDRLPVKLPVTFRIVQWISSTLGYLARPNVQLFISHCGIDSVYESIWFGTAVLCLQFMGDQHDIAQRVADAGVGRWLEHMKVMTTELQATIVMMFEEKEYSVRQKNIQRIQRIIRLHGGVERAVDLIEMATEYGVDSFIPVNNSHPWYAYYNLDVYAFWLFVCLLLKQLITCCCCCRHPRSLPNISPTKTKIS